MAKPKARGRKDVGAFHFRPIGSRPLKLKPGAQSIDLRQIRPRAGTDTRPLSPHHIVNLARSIADDGLIQPLAIDTTGQLIAGGHRLAACWLLSIEDPTARAQAFLTALKDYKARTGGLDLNTDGKLPEGAALAREVGRIDAHAWATTYKDEAVPVLVLDSDNDSRAMRREIAENDKRRDYSKAEVVSLVERLKEDGFENLKGRPAGEQRSLRLELARILGKSLRHVRRLLNDPDVAKAKSRTSDRLSERRALLSLAKKLEKARKAVKKNDGPSALLKDMADFTDTINARIGDLNG